MMGILHSGYPSKEERELRKWKAFTGRFESFCDDSQRYNNLYLEITRDQTYTIMQLANVPTNEAYLS